MFFICGVIFSFFYISFSHLLAFGPVIQLNRQNIRLMKFIFSFFHKEKPKKVYYNVFTKKVDSFPLVDETKQPSNKNNDSISFEDIVGIDEILEQVEEVVSYIKNKEKYKALGARCPRGILLHGAPGTGKTLIARAIAKEAGCSVLYESGSAFIEKYVGVGAERLRTLFAKAQEQKPAIIFIDEIDAIASNRNNNSSCGEYRQTINQLLCLMDGFNTEKYLDDILVIGATNSIASLDPAILRSGRFDYVINIPLPDEEGRYKIIEHYIKKLPSTSISDYEINKFAKNTNFLSGADLNNIVNQAAFAAARDNSTVVTYEHLLKSFESFNKS